MTTLADLDPQALAPVLDVPTAGALLGLGASLSWRLSRERGELAPGVPVLALGRRRVVPTAAVLRALGIEVGQ